MYQITIQDLTEISTRLRFQSRDPIVRQVLVKTERWGVENAYTRAVTIFETFLKKLNEEIFRVSGKPPKKLPRPNLFQNVDDIQKWFINNHGTDLFISLSLEDERLLRSIISKRHVITHNNGIIDDAFIVRTGEYSGKQGKPVELSENEILQSIQVVQHLIEVAKEAFVSLR